MKTYIKLIFVSIFALITVSCEDKLDIDPQQGFTPENAFDTAEKVNTLLSGAYARAGRDASYGGHIYTIAELLGNNTELGWNGTFIDLGEINQKNISTTNGYVEAFWTNGYGVANQTNIVLENLDVFDNADARNSAEGQAKFLRALIYFDLVRFFAKHNNNGVNNLEDGVPIIRTAVLSLDDITYPFRDTIEDVYEFIIQDLEDAAALLPASNGVFASSNAAKALLARVHLQIGNLEPARDLSNEVIQSGLFSLNQSFFDAFGNEENTSEDIFAWQVTDSDGSNVLTTFWSLVRFGGRPGNPDISIEDEYFVNDYFNIFDTFQDDRAQFFYVDPDSGSGRATGKWLQGRSNIPFIRLAEMYLIRAEANYLLGTTVGDFPVNDVNLIRWRAGAFLLDPADFSYTSIFLERLKELSFEGHKIHDLKRVEQLPIGGFSFDANELVLPIPERETSVNDNLDQNDGY